MSEKKDWGNRENVNIQNSQPGGFGRPGAGFGRPMGGPHGVSLSTSKPKDAKKTLKRLLKYLSKHRILFLFVIIAILINIGVSLLNPYLIGKTIDSFIIPKDFKGLFRMLLVLGILYILSIIFTWLQSYIMMHITQKTIFEMRNDVFAKLQKLPIHFFDTKQHGDIMSRLTNDIDNLSNTLNSSLVQIFSSGITLIGTVIIMLNLSIIMTIVSLLVVPIMFYCTNFIAKRTRKFYTEQQSKLGQINGIIEEDITGLKVIKVFDREEEEINKFEKINNEFRSVGIKAQIFSGVIPPMMNVLTNLSFALVAAAGGYLALNKVITIGTIATFINYSRQFTRPLNELANQFNMLQSGFASAERIFAIIDEKPEKPDTEDAINLKNIKGELEFKNVSFSYNKDFKVLKNISFKARPGQTIAIVGPTGAGKTTIVNLLMRFYDVDQGSILLDGVDIRKIKRDNLRKAIGIVLQDTFLFSETITDNIRYGKIDALEEEVERAAKLSNAHQFIKRLQNGYKTILSDNGFNLSQGQRQLLAISRAILADPAILILDEATSNIDTRTEKHVQEAMLNLMKGRTSIVIAHRLSTIKNADLILFINDGQIVESGTHDELLNKKGFYYNLYMSQFSIV
ncbi:ABC transporter ATP-binding protein [Caldicellulosiruptoraceae bacterium PP1]